MKRNTKSLFLFLVLTFITSFIFGVAVGRYYPQIKNISSIIKWDYTTSTDWPDDFAIVTIPSSADDTEQSAYFIKAPSEKTKPLVISLHSWSGNYSQNDVLASMAKDAGWNYIHPDFRGPNQSVDACLSEKVISDIDDAIQYAINNGNVDLTNIFVAGASGGGYATLGVYLKNHHQIRAFFSWVPISDLTAWYNESLIRGTKYAKNILNCTSEGTILNIHEARLRSPLFWELPKKLSGRLEIYAGINDGYNGSVPISHSILFYNRIAEHFGYQTDLVTQDDILKLLTRGIDQSNDLGMLGGRQIYYIRDTSLLSLTIFDGGHEMLPEYCFERMQTIVESSKD